MKINPEQWYSLHEVQKLAKIKSRTYLVKFINEGKLMAIQTGAGGPSTGIRYTILGKWVIDFNKRYKEGVLGSLRYTKEQMKELLEQAIKDLK